ARVPRRALVADELARLHDLAALDGRPREMRVDAPIPVAVVDHDADRQRVQEVLLREAELVAVEPPAPADPGVETAPDGEDSPGVRSDDPVAAEGGEVEAVMGRLALVDGATESGLAEWLGQAALGDG